MCFSVTTEGLRRAFESVEVKSRLQSCGHSAVAFIEHLKLDPVQSGNSWKLLLEIPLLG